MTAYATNSPNVTAQIVDEAWADYSRLVGDVEPAPAAPALSVAPTPIVAAAAAVVASAAIAAPAAPSPAAGGEAAPQEPAAVSAPAVATAQPEPTPAPVPLTADLVASDRGATGDDDLPVPEELRSPWWAAPRAATVVTVVAIVAMLALNFVNRSPVPNRDPVPTPETAVARMPVVSADADPLVTPPSPAEARTLVHEYMLAYEARDPERIAALFAPAASDNDHEGVGAIRAAYAQAFGRLTDVVVSVPLITTEVRGERLALSGPIRVTYRDADGTSGEMRGTAEWEIARQAGTPRILRLQHDVAPRTS